jgi:hypothetical protein
MALRQAVQSTWQKVGVWGAVIGFLDWFARYELVKDWIKMFFGTRIAHALSISWLSPAIMIVGIIVFAASKVIGHFKSRPLEVEIICDDSLGPEARLTVKNNGVPADFIATAKVLEVREAAANTRRRQTFSLPWLDSGTSTVHIPHSDQKVLRLAEGEALRQGQDHFNEMRLLESRSDGVKPLEGFRWEMMERTPPEVTIEVSIVRVAPASNAHTENFVIAGGEYGGIRIRSLTSGQIEPNMLDAAAPPVVVTEPEVMLDYEKNPHEKDGHLVIRHTGGGSARNVQVGQMSCGHWVADSEPISSLAVGSTEKVRTRLTAATPQAARDQMRGGYMTLDFFLMTPLDVGPIPVTVTHEDAASRRKYETDFAVTYREVDGRPYIAQKARRIMPLATP